MSAGKNQKKQEENTFLNSTLNKLSKPYRVQSAAVLNPKDVSLEDMFVLANRIDTNWGIEGYDPQKKYADPMKQIQEREFLKQKKGQKDKKYVCKKGHYLDDLSKITKVIPGPNKYDLVQKWKNPKGDGKKPMSAPSKRMTYIDQIYHEQKTRATPGVGKYDLELSEKEKQARIDEIKKRKIPFEDRPNFLCEYEHLSQINPGPGQYNPRDIQPKLQKNLKEPKDYIEKHKQEQSKRAKSALPDPSTYKPYPANYSTFGRMFENKQQKQEGSSRAIKYWGTDERFRDPKKTKSKLTSVLPGPGAYQMIAAWPSKEDGMKKDKQSKTKNWMNNLTKGAQKSIYY